MPPPCASMRRLSVSSHGFRQPSSKQDLICGDKKCFCDAMTGRVDINRGTDIETLGVDNRESGTIFLSPGERGMASTIADFFATKASF